ncbi:MAG: hypothetical protein QFF03_02660 [Pseudomonadota bacterium]|nr:hypothetical protein [Pseudomonadota bacterium]
MNTARNLLTSTDERDAVRTHRPALNRRTFMRYLTAGAAAIVVEGCGGGGGGATAVSAPVVAPAPVPVPVPAPTPAPVATTWVDVPEIAFTEGVASSFSVASYVKVSNSAAITLSLNAIPLPSGVTFNSRTLSFDYDGRGTQTNSDGHVLIATVG